MTKRKILLYFKTYRLLIATVAAIVVIYFQYFQNGTFYVDDWGFVEGAHLSKNNVIQSIHTSFQSMAFRPIAEIVLPALAAIFRSNFVLIAIFNLAIYSTAVTLATRVVLKLFNNKICLSQSLSILILFFLPIISTTFIFSPLTHVATTLSVLLWAFSLYYTTKAAEGGKVRYFILTALFIILALLCYEIFIPLLALNIGAYVYIQYQNNTKLEYRRLFKQIALIVGVILSALLVTVLYQKKIAVLFGGNNNSRLHFSSFGYFVRRYIEDWFRLLWVLRFDLKTVVLQSFNLSFDHPVFVVNSLVAASLACYGSYTLRLKSKIKKRASVTSDWVWLIAIVAGVLLSILMITVSLYPVSLGGYLNRMLFPLWFIFALTIIILNRYIRIRYLLPTVFIIVFGASIVFQAQLNKYGEGSIIRKSIQSDIRQKLATVQSSDLAIIGDVPRCVPDTLMNDDVFSEQWDFGSIAKFESNYMIKKGSVMQLWNFQTPNMYQLTTDKLTLFGWFTITQKDMPVLLYQYDLKTKQSSLITVRSFDELKGLAISIKTSAHDNCKEMNAYGPYIDRLDAKLQKLPLLKE